MYGYFHSTPTKPQTKAIFEHLIREGNLSGIEAQAMYKCRSLTKRISEIKQETGLTVLSAWKVDATGQRYVRYYVEPRTKCTQQQQQQTVSS